jgi:two-component system, NarL family, sensor kinase
VRCEEKSIHITISDKGRGFNPHEALLEETDKSRLGLVSIRERLRLFGGELTIRSAPGQGTQVTIVLPYLNY